MVKGEAGLISDHGGSRSGLASYLYRVSLSGCEDPSRMSLMRMHLRSAQTGKKLISSHEVRGISVWAGQMAHATPPTRAVIETVLRLRNCIEPFELFSMACYPSSLNLR